MRKVLLYSGLLLIGLIFSQFLPVLLAEAHNGIAIAIRVLTAIIKETGWERI